MGSLTLVSMPLQVASGQQNACAVTADPVAPEFLVSLNTCTPKEKPQPSMDPMDAATVQAILDQVVARLNGPLDAIWNGCDGNHPEWAPKPTSTPAQKASIEADEIWARWCTELMVGTGYGGTPEYGSGIFNDEKFYRAFAASNPVVPVKMACQQLCTYAYYSRGWTFDEVQGNGLYGVTAAQNSHLDKLFESGWDTDAAYRVVKAGFGRAKGPTSPGTLLAFRPIEKEKDDKKKQKPGSHVVFILRVAPRISKAQFFDTGAALEPDTKRSKTGVAPLAAKNFNGGNYDNRLFEDEVNVRIVPDVRYVGIGVLKPKPPGEITAAVAKARRVRPLGFARLAVLKRRTGGAYEKSDILYVSPRVWMHDPSSDANYYISRYLWSLRQTPGYENVEVLWQISHPQDVAASQGSKDGKVKPSPGDPFATKAFEAARTTPLKDVWGPKKRSNYSTFLTMSNDASVGGPAVMRQRIKLKPVKDGQILVEEGDLAKYHAVVEYRFQRIDEKKKTPPQPVSISGLMGTLQAGEDYRHKDLRGTLKPPAYFAPW